MRYVVSVLALALLLVAAACSNGSETTITVVPPLTATATGQGDSPEPTNDATSAPTSAPTATPTPGDDGSIIVACDDQLVPLDKLHRLPSDCEPANLVNVPGEYTWGGSQLMTAEAADALVTMLEAGAEDGYFMFAASSYRNYQHQVDTFQMWVNRLGEAEAEKQSARPGHSEHQLGTTTDLTIAANGGDLDAFRGTPEAEWVAQHSWKFGFIVSYPPDLEHVTGYVWEPWHVRYVGVDVAADVHASGLTLGEYLKQR